VTVGDVGAGIEDRGGQWQQDDAMTCGHVLEFLLDGAEDGRPAAAGPHFGGDVTPLGYRVGILEQMLVSQVGDRDRVFPGQTVAGSIATRGSASSARTCRPLWSTGRRT
jgi:hypothetical protein